MKKFIDIEKINDICNKSYGFAIKDGNGFQCVAPENYVVIYGYFDENNVFKMDYESADVKRHNVHIGRFSLKIIESILDKVF